MPIYKQLIKIVEKTESRSWSSMFYEFLKKILIILAWCGIFLSAGSFLLSTLEATTNKQTIETTIAKPIYQKRIGDDTTPDILIIYEAEVNGVKVYPSVIKEAK